MSLWTTDASPNPAWTLSVESDYNSDSERSDNDDNENDGAVKIEADLSLRSLPSLPGSVCVVESEASVMMRALSLHLCMLAQLAAGSIP